MEKKDQGTLAAYLDLFLQRKLLFLTVFVVLFVVLGLGAMSVKTSYRATSLLAIGETDQIGLYQQNTGGRAKPLTASASFSGKTYATIVTGMPISVAIAAKMSTDTLVVEPLFISRAVNAEFYDPEVLEITARAKNPDHAVAIANVAAEVFIEDNRSRIRGEMEESAQFVLNEIGVVERELALIQQDIGDFKKREQVTDLDVETAELLGAVTEFEKDRTLAQADLSEQQARYEEFYRHLFSETKIKVSPLESPAVRGLVARLSELQVKLERAKTEYGPEHPMRKLLEEQVLTTRESLETAALAPQDGAASLTSESYYSSLRTELTSTGIRIIGLDARIQALGDAINAGRAKLAELPPKSFELQRFLLKASITEDKYRRLLERLEAMEV